MPLSAVLYTSKDAFDSLKRAMARRFEGRAVKPYTFSFPQKQEGGGVRFRATELSDGALVPLVEEMAERGEATLASWGDRDVRRASYGDIVADADRAMRSATLRLASPVIVPVMGCLSPFPVVPAIFSRYIEVWGQFSDVPLQEAAFDALRRVRVADFRLSCAATPFGTGAEGWVTLEMEKGRTEEEIGLLNALVDFAFYCGTGILTEEGMGQTRRMDNYRG